MNWATHIYGAVIVSSSSEIKGCEASNILDDDISKIWLSEEGIPQWICISLENITDINNVVIKTIGWECWHDYTTNPREIRLHVSRDGTKFKIWDTFTAKKLKAGQSLFCCEPISAELYPFIALEIMSTFGGKQTYLNRIFLCSEEANSFNLSYDDAQLGEEVEAEELDREYDSLSDDSLSWAQSSVNAEEILEQLEEDHKGSQAESGKFSEITDIIAAQLEAALGLTDDFSMSSIGGSSKKGSKESHGRTYGNHREDPMVFPVYSQSNDPESALNDIGLLAVSSAALHSASPLPPVPVKALKGIASQQDTSFHSRTSVEYHQHSTTSNGHLPSEITANSSILHDGSRAPAVHSAVNTKDMSTSVNRSHHSVDGNNNREWFESRLQEYTEQIISTLSQRIPLIQTSENNLHNRSHQTNNNNSFKEENYKKVTSSSFGFTSGSTQATRMTLSPLDPALSKSAELNLSRSLDGHHHLTNHEVQTSPERVSVSVQVAKEEEKVAYRQTFLRNTHESSQEESKVRGNGKEGDDFSRNHSRDRHSREDLHHHNRIKDDMSEQLPQRNRFLNPKNEAEEEGKTGLLEARQPLRLELSHNRKPRENSKSKEKPKKSQSPVRKGKISRRMQLYESIDSSELAEDIPVEKGSNQRSASTKERLSEQIHFEHPEEEDDGSISSSEFIDGKFSETMSNDNSTEDIVPVRESRKPSIAKNDSSPEEFDAIQRIINQQQKKLGKTIGGDKSKTQKKKTKKNYFKNSSSNSSNNDEVVLSTTEEEEIIQKELLRRAKKRNSNKSKSISKSKTDSNDGGNDRNYPLERSSLNTNKPINRNELFNREINRYLEETKANNSSQYRTNYDHYSSDNKRRTSFEQPPQEEEKRFSETAKVVPQRQPASFSSSSADHRLPASFEDLKKRNQLFQNHGRDYDSSLPPHRPPPTSFLPSTKIDPQERVNRFLHQKYSVHSSGPSGEYPNPSRRVQEIIQQVKQEREQELRQLEESNYLADYPPYNRNNNNPPARQSSSTTNENNNYQNNSSYSPSASRMQDQIVHQSIYNSIKNQAMHSLFENSSKEIVHQKYPSPNRQQPQRTMKDERSGRDINSSSDRGSRAPRDVHPENFLDDDNEEINDLVKNLYQTVMQKTIKEAQLKILQTKTASPNHKTNQ
jgi:hypothetical protein